MNMKKVEPDDIVKYGLIPELVGRIPVITVLDPLDEDALIRVLEEPKNSLLKQYKMLFRLDNVELDFTNSALHAVAEKAIKLGGGARGLRSIMEKTLMGVMYEIPSDPTIIKVVVNDKVVNDEEKAKLEFGAVRKRYKNSSGPTALSG